MTTDFRALCAALIDALDSGIPAERIRMSPLAQRALAALAEPEPEGMTPQPVPVSKRLPGPGDCDAEGRCWIHMPDMGTAPSWRLVDPREIGPYHTHWLPAHALPVPSHD